MSNFNTQVQEYLNLEFPKNRKLSQELEGGVGSLSIRRYKDVVIKVPHPEEYEFFVEGYQRAFQKGFINNLHIEGCELFVPFVEGTPITKNTDLTLLINQMQEAKHYLVDWKTDNVFITSNSNKVEVIDWGYWTDNREEFLRDYSRFISS